MSLTRIFRGLLFHGRIDQLARLRWHDYQLEKYLGFEDKSPFHAEVLYVKRTRAQEKLYYGESLSRQQRDWIKANTSHGFQELMLGRFVQKDGRLVFRKYIEAMFAMLSIMLTIASFSVFAVIGFDLVSQGLGFLGIIKAQFLLMTLLIIPSIYFLAISFLPVIEYLQSRDLLKSLR